MALTKLQEDFIGEYMQNGYNATQAYLKVYGGDYKKANKNAYKTYHTPEVKREIERRQMEIYETLNISAERIATELSTMAFAEKGDKDYNATAKLKALDLLQKQLGLQQQKIKADVETTTINLTIGDEDGN